MLEKVSTQHQAANLKWKRTEKQSNWMALANEEWDT